MQSLQRTIDRFRGFIRTIFANDSQHVAATAGFIGEARIPAQGQSIAGSDQTVKHEPITDATQKNVIAPWFAPDGTNLHQCLAMAKQRTHAGTSHAEHDRLIIAEMLLEKPKGIGSGQ